jgi:hypothetical protein
VSEFVSRVDLDGRVREFTSPPRDAGTARIYAARTFNLLPAARALHTGAAATGRLAGEDVEGIGAPPALTNNDTLLAWARE